MEPRDTYGTGSYGLRLADIDLAHLRAVVPAEIRNPRRVFPLAYWRWRVTRILEDTHLVPTQMAAASALLAQIDEAMESTQPLARAG